jgi:signal transduction histidine kinase
MRRADGQYRHMSVRGVPVLESSGAIREWVGTCTDITERQEAEKRREFTNALLALFARKTSSKDYLAGVVDVLRTWSGCQAAGIRIVDDQQEVPYEAWSGFQTDFIRLEHRLSLAEANCCCTRAVAQAAAACDRSLLTAGGSYRCDDLPAFLSRLSPEERREYGDACARFGFVSLAVIPLRYGVQMIGAIHLADRRRDQFPPSMVDLIESMTPLIGEAIHRFKAEAELARYHGRLEEIVRQRTSELEAANARLQVEITERKRAQEELQQTAAELERSNRDLEQFAYVASHDLQEPLRAVGGYVRLLERRFPEDIDVRAREYILGASDGATRMERLITDLLSFSRVGTQGESFVLTDLNLVLERALQNLQASIQAARAQVTSDPLPTLVVDAGQIAQLFQNLIGNAIKFQSERQPEIHVTAGRRETGWVISVRDNGIGIDPHYFERIFQIFQRLHTRKRYPGTGIGLAICKRIVERHGGGIWVESAPGAGSTFCLSFPDTSAKDQEPYEHR